MQGNMEHLIGNITDLESTCSEQTGLKETMLTVLQDEDLSHPEMLMVRKEAVTPETLFSKAVLTGPMSFRRILREILVFLGIPISAVHRQQPDLVGTSRPAIHK